MGKFGIIITLTAVSLMAMTSFSSMAVNRSADMFDRLPTVTTDKDVYMAGETLRINITCYIPASFSSSGQCYFTVVDELGNTVYDMRNHVWVLWVLTSLVPPKTFTFQWSQEDNSGQLVKPGNYEIWGFEAGWSFWGPPLIGNSTSISIVERCDVSLVHGWNLFSLPLLTSQYTSDSLGLPAGSIVVSWDPVHQSYGSVFVVGMSPPSASFAILEGTGYWIYAMSPCNVSILGVPIATTHSYEWVVPATGGWVLVGFPRTGGSCNASDIAGWSNVPDQTWVVSYYDSSTGSFETYISDLPTPDFAIALGMGYWVHIDQSVTIAYSV